MIALGIAVAWAGYGILSNGYYWLKGYDLSWGQIWSPGGYYKGTWPPQIAPNTTLIPTGQSGTSGTGGTAAGSTGTEKSITPKTPLGNQYPYGAAGPPGGG